MMKAVWYDRYGRPDVLEVREVPVPEVPEDGMLVQVRAASVNPLDWHTMTGTPYLVRLTGGLRAPRDTRLGVDFAGTVTAVGPAMTRFAPGDDVFGGAGGAFGEYLTVRRSVAAKPANLSFEQAAAVPVAAVTALQGLRDRGRIQSGQQVLVNGASGGVGTFAVQLARSFGATVTGVCSTANVEAIRDLGADHVVDYTHTDFAGEDRRYDLVLDVAGGRSWADYRRVLTAAGTLVVVGGPKRNRWVGPLGAGVRLRVRSLPGRRRVVAPFLASLNPDDLATLAGLLADGRIRPVVDRRYALADVPDALRHVGAGHARGKVVITI